MIMPNPQNLKKKIFIKNKLIKMKFFFFILCISLLVLILSKSDELSILKALACVNIITSRHQNEEPDPSTLSPKILTCFIKISDEQISKLLDNIEQGLDISLTED